MTPTVTLQDCVNAYLEQKKAYDEQTEQEAREKMERAEQVTREGFEKIGLEPYSVSGSMAFFDLGGLKVTFIVKAWKYGSHGVYRKLDETCPKCHDHFYSDEFELNIENIGALLTNPQKRYHDCPEWNSSVTSDLPVVEKSAGEKLLEALDFYMASQRVMLENL